MGILSLPTLTPLKILLFEASRRITFSASIARMKRNGDNGSPCLRPLSTLNSRVGDPFTRTDAYADQDPKTVSDFQPISLIGSLYKVVTKILAIRLSSVISDLISDVQTAFLPNRQILDGPFIINELLSWCRHKKQQAMVFKVDFAKAYDSVRWDYPDDVLFSFGFGVKWRSWIKGSLISGMASVLVNGSPTSEFQFHCGLLWEKITSKVSNFG
ncbi:RNA-directed DNA polymerase, eukaryota [Tanacetum coccineum]